MSTSADFELIINGQSSLVLEEDPVSSTPPPWQLIDLQDCLHDSPQFRKLLHMKEQELVDLEGKLEKVVSSCSNMVETGQVYRENCRLFTLSLKELTEHFVDLPNVMDAIQKICDAFNELQSHYSILFDHAQRTVTKGLKEFLTGELRKVHNSKKSFHKTSAELNYVIHKNATSSRQKPSEADEMSSLLQTTQVEFTHQALDYCYQINVVSCLKGHRITEKLISFLGATTTFFQDGFGALKHLDPFVRQVTKEMDELQVQSHTDINYMKDRHSLVSAQHLQDESHEIPVDNVAMPIAFCGYLFKRAHNAFKSWNRRYFELRDSKLFYLKKGSENEYGVIADDLRLCTVKLADDLERHFCFEVVTPSRSCMLQADSEADRRKWCMYLEAGIARALRVTSSNKSREAKETRRRLTSSATILPHFADSLNPRMDSPILYNRSDTPSSITSNFSCSFDFLEVPGNDRCADCSRVSPKWASLNLGIVLCIDCSGVHRSLGVHISKVRSITLDDWEGEHQKIMSLLGNDRVNSIYEFEVPLHVKKPTPTTPSSEREEYIRLKYVSRAFVHSHPDFERPEVPVPPPRIQGTLLRAAATSPKLAGRLNRPLSMATGLDVCPSPVSSPLPPRNSKSPTPALSSDSSPLGGLNLRPESMALLEENWKKLEKNGRLQQWNLKSMYNVVKSPRKTFSLHKFTRPGSFRRKKSPLITDDYPHSDNELEDSFPSLRAGRPVQSLSPNPLEPPLKPPRTYTTTAAHIDSSSGDSISLFNPEGDDFSSDLLNTLERLGSVYSINVLCGEEADGGGAKEEQQQLMGPHKKMMRSISAIDSFKPNQLQEIMKEESQKIPLIHVESDKVLKEEEDEVSLGGVESSNLALRREVSRSMGSINTDEVAATDLLDTAKATPTHQATKPGSEENPNTTPTHASMEDNQSVNSLDVESDLCGEFTLKRLDFGNYELDDDSSVDSYMSAEERHEFITNHGSSSRPDSSASELFHTPPNSISSSPTGLESIDPTLIANLGLALGVNVTLEDSQSTVKRAEPSSVLHNVGDLSLVNELDETVKETSKMSPVTDDHRTMEVSGQTVQQQQPTDHVTEHTGHVTDESIPVTEEGPDQTTEHVTTEEGVPTVEKVDGESESRDLDNTEHQEEMTGLLSEYDVHIIPDDIHPSTLIFECSLNGDLAGILSGIAHGGVVNLPNKEEGDKYPIHQACITGNEATVEFLYQNGGKISVVDSRGCSPLHLAAMNDYASLAAILLKHGADHLCIDKESKDPLAYATERENADIVTMLKLAKVNGEVKSGKDSEDARHIMDDATEGVYKDFIGGDMKRRSVSSINSTPSTDRMTSGSDISVSSITAKVSGLLNSKSKSDT